MSQITRLENPAAPATARVNTAIPIPRAGIVVDGNVVPQQVLPPVSEGAVLAAQLGQDLGLLGSAADEVRQYQDRQRALTDRAAAEARAKDEFDRKNAAVIDAAEHGDGHFKAGTMVPGVLLDIDTGKIPREAMTSAEQAAKIVDGLVKDQPEAWASGFRQRAQDDIARALTGVDAKVIAANRESVLASLQAGAIGAKTPEQMAAAVTSAKSLAGVSELDALEGTALAAMKAAAMTGNPAQFKLAADALGPDRFALEQQKLASLLSESENRRVLDTERKADEAVYAMLNEGRPTESIAYAVGQMRKLGTISERKAAQFFGTLKASDEDKARENAKLATLVAEDAFRRDVLQNNVSLALHAEATGGMATFQDREINLGSKTVKVTEAEQRKSATEYGLAMIRDEVLRGTPPEKATADQQQQVFGQSVKFLAANGAKNEAWSNAMAAGFLGADVTALTEAEKIPVNVAAGYELWKRLGVMSPQLRDAHLPNESARAFYDAAELSERYVTPGNPRQALIEAAKILARDKPGAAAQSVGSYVLDRAVNDILTDGRDAKNYNDVARSVSRLSKFYLDLGRDPQTAVDLAAKKFRESNTKVNGWYVPSSGLPAPIREALPAIAEEVAKAYVAKYPGDGVTADDLTLAPDGRDGFMLVRGDDGLLVERASADPVLAIFTSRDLWNLWTKKLEVDRTAAVAKQLDAGAATAEHLRGTATLTPPGLPGLGAIRAMAANNSIMDQPILVDPRAAKRAARGGKP